MVQMLSAKLGAGSLLDANIMCQSVVVPNEYLNVKTGRAKFALSIENDETLPWKPFSINGKAIRLLKQVLTVRG